MAQEIMDQYRDDNEVISSNIYLEGFVHAAADNTDINEETRDGLNTTRVTSTVLYPQKQMPDLMWHLISCRFKQHD